MEGVIFIQDPIGFLRDGILDDQLRAACRASVPAENVQVVGDRIVVVAQFETQADLRQAAIRRQFVDPAFGGG